MKQIVNISLITGLYNEWNGMMNIKVNEDFDDLIERIRINQKNGTTIIPIKRLNNTITAINLNYITEIWVKEVEE